MAVHDDSLLEPPGPTAAAGVAERWQQACSDAVALAVSAVPGCAGAELMLTGQGSVRTVAATSPAARALDEAQHEHGDGPCLAAVRSGQVVSCPDYLLEQRWPAVLREAAAAGVNSSLSVPLSVDGTVMGALNLYSRSPRAFDVPAQRTASMLARQSAATLDHLAHQRMPRLATQASARVVYGDLQLPASPAIGADHGGPAQQHPGGDWVDVLALPDGATGLVIGDAMGHDTHAASIRARLRAALRTHAHHGKLPGAVLDGLDQLVQDPHEAQLATVL
jgi:hypothetical protein